MVGPRRVARQTDRQRLNQTHRQAENQTICQRQKQRKRKARWREGGESPRPGPVML